MRTINSAFKFEMKPTKSQEILLVKSAGIARFTWNWALARRIALFNSCETKERFTNAMKQNKELVKLKETKFSWMYEVSKSAPQNSLRDLDKSFKAFWRNRKTGQGFPKFKKKFKHDSFRVDAGIEIFEKSIKLPVIGKIKLKEDSSRFNGRILSATCSREADRWFVAINVEREIPDPVGPAGEPLGIDLGLKTFATFSDGTKIDSLKPLKKFLKILKKRSKQFSKNQKGSNNKNKARLKLARLHRKIKNIRLDFLHKLTTKLTKTNSVLIIEDLQVNKLVKGKKFSRQIQDVSWSEFRRQLEYKSKWYGSKILVADKFFPSSQLCSCCGSRQEIGLEERTFICKSCRFTLDRDENAARNLVALYTGSSPEINACGEKDSFLVETRITT